MPGKRRLPHRYAHLFAVECLPRIKKYRISSRILRRRQPAKKFHDRTESRPYRELRRHEGHNILLISCLCLLHVSQSILDVSSLAFNYSVVVCQRVRVKPFARMQDGFSTLLTEMASRGRLPAALCCVRKVTVFTVDLHA